mmetsp:Transcript_22924/g.33288  ORF Transcript_22924/g.33288 Transcript_22924/m.33288 type:complete len:93 (-) Transcript_22924:189-467(-)
MLVVFFKRVGRIMYGVVDMVICFLYGVVLYWYYLYQASAFDMTEEDSKKIMNEAMVGKDDCGVSLKVLEEFVARITLSGDYAVPLKFAVLKR